MSISRPARPTRWYDSLPDIAQMLGNLQLFPQGMRPVISEGIVQLAEAQFQAHTLMTSLKSLGPDVIRQVYQSSRNQRALDSDPATHKAVNYLLILPPEARTELCRLTSELIECVSLYLKFCREGQLSIKLEHIRLITRQFTTSGVESARQVIAGLSRQLSGYKASKSSDTTFVQSKDSGMRLRRKPVTVDGIRWQE